MKREDENISDLDFVKHLDDSSADYYQVHKARFQYLLSVVKDLRKNFSSDSIRILDVGPSLFTKLLERNFPKDEIISLGFEHEKSRGGHLPPKIELNKAKFFNFNLNDSQYREKWIELPKCEIIIMAEVLEHLFTAPSLVLYYLSEQLAGGGYLIIQTPNAASLKNRIKLLLGKNPFEMIRENNENPGHFREYTSKELSWIAERTCFSVFKIDRKSYFNPRNLIENIYMNLTRLLPGSFRDGLTIVLKKL